MKLINANAMLKRNEFSIYDTTDLKEMLDYEPVAYDVDKVVEDLQQMKLRYFLTIANTGNEIQDKIYEEVGNAIDKAIDIVKGAVKNE